MAQDGLQELFEKYMSIQCAANLTHVIISSCVMRDSSGRVDPALEQWGRKTFEDGQTVVVECGRHVAGRRIADDRICSMRR